MALEFPKFWPFDLGKTRHTLSWEKGLFLSQQGLEACGFNGRLDC